MALGGPGTAQDKPVAAPKFDDVYAEWSKVDRRINDVIQQYRLLPRNAGRAERETLLKQYNELTAQSRELLTKLRPAAIAAYKAAPNADKRVTQTMVGLVGNDVRQDRYEAALELAKLLFDNKCNEPALDAFAGIAAYCLDDFDTAETHLKKAEAAGAMTDVATNCLEDLPIAKAAWAKEQTLRAKEAEADDLPRVRLETNKGTMVIELYENEAPIAVANFISLVEKKFYDGLTFHRVLSGFMAQGGCPNGTGTGGPGYHIPCECYQENHRNHFRGTLSMAHAGRDTGGSQFFLTFKRTPHLDGKHTVFGRVIEGIDVLAKLQRRDPSRGGKLTEPDKIVKAEIIRKRDHEYKPTKVGDAK